MPLALTIFCINFKFKSLFCIYTTGNDYYNIIYFLTKDNNTKRDSVGEKLFKEAKHEVGETNKSS